MWDKVRLSLQREDKEKKSCVPILMTGFRMMEEDQQRYAKYFVANILIMR